jgi:hypothetical protein
MPVQNKNTLQETKRARSSVGQNFEIVCPWRSRRRLSAGRIGTFGNCTLWHAGRHVGAQASISANDAKAVERAAGGRFRALPRLVRQQPACQPGRLGQVNAAGRPYAAPDVRYWSNSGQNWILARDGLSANDP